MSDNLLASDNNLPSQVTAFVGREHELGQLGHILQDDSIRLITLFAPGGMGKTRLSLELAREQLANYRDGVFFVALASLASHEYVITTIADALGLHLQGELDSSEQVKQYLSDKHLLLILDNFEHVLEASSFVHDLLTSAPMLKIIVTSREKLELRGEKVYAIGGMSFSKQATAQDALEEDATQLFLQSARLSRADFSLSDNDFAYLIQICQLTYGMPLAIILAAVWVDVLSLEEIAGEIQKNMDFLATKMANIPRRQWSIRAIFELTWKRLNDEEQNIFIKFALFHGGCSREATQNITGANLAQLQVFVNKALLILSMQGRYEIHELLRQYIEEQLHASEEVDKLYRAYSDYYLGFLARRESRVKGHGQTEALLEIKADFENIRRAWGIAIERENYSALNNALESLLWYCIMNNHHLEGESLLRLTYTTLKGQNNNPSLRVIYARFMARILYLKNCYAGKYLDPDEVKGLLENSLLVAQDTNNELEIVVCQFYLANLYSDLRELDTAITLLKQSLEKFLAHDDYFYAAHVLNIMYLCAYASGDQNKAIEYMERVLAIRREIGDTYSLVFALYNFVGLFLSTGNYALAERYVAEANIISQGTQLHELIQAQRTILAILRGDFHVADALCPGVNNTLPHAHKSMIQFIQSLLACMLGDYQHARQISKDGLRNPPGEFHTFFFNWGYALVSYLQGDIRSAIVANRNALRFGLSIKLPARLLWCLPASAMIAKYQGKHEQAIELLSLAYNHPASATGWLDKWSVIQQFRQDLENEAGSEAYFATWEGGKTLDLKKVVRNLLAEYRNILVNTSNPVQEANKALIEPLTARELEVLVLLGEGLSNREIATQLTVVVGTVKSHVHNICQKLAVKSRTQATRKAEQLGLF